MLGRKLSEIFAAYWPTATSEGEFADLMNDSDEYVASCPLDDVEWQNSTLFEDNTANAVAELKRQSGGDL